VFPVRYEHRLRRASKAIPVTHRRNLSGCEILRILHFLYNRLTDGGEVVSLARCPSRLLTNSVELSTAREATTCAATR
jgi:hypothetical protein